MCSSFRVIPRDWARMGYLLLHRGRWNDEQILSPESVQMLSTWPAWLTGATVDNWLKNSARNVDHQDSNLCYAHTFWLNNHQRLKGFPPDAFMASGGAHKLIICPSYDMVIVRAGNYTSDHIVRPQLYQLINEAVLPENGNP
jgi:CubicO group peptidase (beta-lactamase class C family)